MFNNIDEARGASKTSAINNPNAAAETIAKHLLSKREVAAILGVSPRTIDNFIAQRRVPYLRLSARLFRFDLSRVKAALARYEVKEGGRR